MKPEQEKALTEMISFINSIKPFTVGQMKQALEGLPDDTQILIGGTENCSFDWANLDLKYNQPDEEKGFMGLTFYLKDDFDARQF
jgi:hypothetical protein